MDRGTVLAGARAKCFLAAALFGAATPASKVLLDSVGAFTLAGLLYAGAAVATLVPAMRSPRMATLRVNMVRLAGAVVLGGVVAPVLLLEGLLLASASSTSLWLTLEGAATALLSWLFFREHLGARTWLAVLVMFAAGAALSLAEGGGGGLAGGLVLAACLCWGVDNNLTAVNDGFTPEQMTFAKGLVAGMVDIALGAWIGPPVGSVSTVAWALLLGALCYGASLVLYIGGAQQLGAARSQVLFSTGPFIGLVLAWVFLDEPVTGVQLFAGVLMATGVWLVQHTQHTHPHEHPPVLHTHPHRHDDGHHDHDHPEAPSGMEHTHPHEHGPRVHEHPHVPDLHHRH